MVIYPQIRLGVPKYGISLFIMVVRGNFAPIYSDFKWAYGKLARRYKHNYSEERSLSNTVFTKTMLNTIVEEKNIDLNGILIQY